MIYTESTNLKFKLFLTGLTCLENSINPYRVIIGAVPKTWKTKPLIQRSFESLYMFYSSDSMLTASYEDVKKVYPPRTLLCMPPGVKYHLKISTPAHQQRAYLYRLRFQHKTQSKEKILPFDTPQVIPQAFFFPEIARQCLSIFNNPSLFREFKIRSQLNLLCALIFEALSTQKKRPSNRLKKGISDFQLSQLSEKIAAQPDRRFSPTELAGQIGYSSSHFTRLFTKQMGINPRKWLVQKRIQLATERLLNSDLSIAEIAIEFGYENQFFFSRQFKEIHGLSPQIYKQQSQSK